MYWLRLEWVWVYISFWIMEGGTKNYIVWGHGCIWGMLEVHFYLGTNDVSSVSKYLHSIKLSKN